MIKTYYELTKPGIIYGNLFVAAAGFFVGTPLPVNWLMFVALLAGLGLVIACAGVCNNYLDRAIDARMLRTQQRATARGVLSITEIYWFATALGLSGVVILFFGTNLLALLVALLGLAVYVLWYTPLKPKNPLALYVGAIAGATPPVVGYAAAAGVVDWYALALFAALYLWQIPHFLAIALYRFEEYQAAGVPLLVGAPQERTKRRARQVFLLSLVVLVVACVGLILQRWMR